MKNYIPVLKRTKLFAGVHEDEISPLLGCLGAAARSYKKGDYVLRAGEYPGDIALLLEGKLHIQSDDYWGNRTILSIIGPGELFCEAYAAPNSGALLNDAVAVEDSAVMFFDIRRLLTSCSAACKFHSLVVQNLFFAVAEKNRKLVGKLGIASRRTTREKLLTYLSEEAKLQGSSSFEIPFNRRQLADFLSVDRSAMSNELCKMRDDGLLSFDKNKFTLYE